MKMNDYQQSSHSLLILLGEVGRAVWMAKRIDGKPLYVIAEEMELPLYKVTEILDTCDYAVENLMLPRREEVQPHDLPVAVNGFHTLDDAGE